MFKTVRDQISKSANVRPLTELPDEDAPRDVAKEPSDLDLAREKHAKFKIEVQYIEARKLHAPSMVSVAVWESGKRFDGGGDESMFWCVDSKEHSGGCGGLIPADRVRNGMALCPHCDKMVNASRLPVERVGLFSARNLAGELSRVFRHLNHDADIYLKFHSSDTEAIHRLRGEGKSPTQRAIYTMERLVRDTSGGADLTKCIENFLTA